MTAPKPTERDVLRTAIAEAIEAVRRRGLAPFNLVRGASLRTTRLCAEELAGANAEMLCALAEAAFPDPPAERIPVTVVHWDADADVIGIDDLLPAARTATRTMLAIANGCLGDAALQLDIAAEAGAAGELRHVLVHLVLWTVKLLDQCDHTGRPAPAWLRHQDG